ncbi:MAG: MFS transporter [bacterium]|nr:MFS transporter [bacterium]
MATNNNYIYRLTLFAIFLFILAALFYCYAYFAQVFPSVITNKLMIKFNVGAMGLSILSGSFFWSYTIMQIPSGLLLDKFGARIVLTSTIFICAVGVLLFSLTNVLYLAVLGRILMGAGCAFSFTGTLYLLIRWFPARRLALFIGFLQLLASLGAIGGEAVLSFLLAIYDWQIVIISFAILGLILSVLVMIFIKNRPFPIPEKNNYKPPSTFKSLKIIFAKSQTWYIAVYSFLIWGPILTFASMWGIPCIRDAYNLSKIDSASLMSLVWIGIAVGSPLAGWLSDFIHKRCIVLSTSALLGLISTLCILYMPGNSIPILMILLFIFGLGASGQTLIFAVVKENNQRSTSGAANGLNNMAVVMGGAILIPLVGYLLDMNWKGVIQNGIKYYSTGNYQLSLSILPICFLIALILSMFFIRETNCKQISNRRTGKN